MTLSINSGRPDKRLSLRFAPAAVVPRLSIKSLNRRMRKNDDVVTTGVGPCPFSTGGILIRVSGRGRTCTALIACIVTSVLAATKTVVKSSSKIFFRAGDYRFVFFCNRPARAINFRLKRASPAFTKGDNTLFAILLFLHCFIRTCIKR